MGNDALRTIIALAVAGCWVVAVLASIATGQYKGLEIVTPVMMLVTGFLFGYQVQVRKASQKEANSDP